MGIEPDRYPSDIITAHDNLAIAFKAQESALTDKMIDAISKAAEKHIPKSEKYLNSEYVIVLPYSSYDIIQEGQNQRNCVGSYLKRIAQRDSFVFFIRKKEDPNMSYVTGEYRDGRITQLYLKNNRIVSETRIHEIAREFASNLTKAQFETKRI